MDFSKIKSISIPEGSAKELSIGGVKVWSGKIGLIYVLSDDGTYYECRGPSSKEITEVVIESEINGIPVTEIDASAFYNCRGITNVVIPDSITSVGSGAFASCTNLKSVVIGKGVTKIPSKMFDYCGSLESVEIPNTVTYIDSEAFSRCTSLTSILIPISVTTILVDVFKGCTNLNTIYCEATSKPTLWVTNWNYDETNKRYIDVVWSEPEEPEEPDTPEVEDELQGLWFTTGVIDVNYYTEVNFNVNFQSNGNIYTGFKTVSTNSLDRNLYYKLAGSSNVKVAVMGEQKDAFIWENKSFSYIKITSKLAEVTNGTALITWLKNNSFVKVNEPLQGLWLLTVKDGDTLGESFYNKTQHLTNISISLIGQSNGYNFSNLSFSKGRKGSISYGDITVYGAKYTASAEAQWDLIIKNPPYKYFYISSKLTEVENGYELLEWLKVVAEKDEMPKTGERLIRDNCDLNNKDDIYTMPFICNNVQYSTLTIKKVGNNYEMYYDDIKVCEYIDFFGGTEWISDEYKLINILCPFTAIKGENRSLYDFLAFETTEPEYQFTLFEVGKDNYGQITTCTFRQGMTWQEWADSDYNTTNIEIGSNGVVYGGSGYSITLNSTDVKSTDYVQATQYEWSHGEHNGGSN